MKYCSFTTNGKDWNEDRCYVCDKFGFVLDGATSLLPQHFSNLNSDAEWSSNWWYEYLKVALHDTSKSILEILEDGINRCIADFTVLAEGKKILDFPACTICVIRRVNGKLQIYVLGDSPIILKTKTNFVFKIADTLNEVVDDLHKAIYQDISNKENSTMIATRKKYPEVIIDGRMKQNSLGGAYVLSRSVEALNHGVYQEIDEEIVEKALLMSDGYSQVFDVVKFMSYEKLINKIDSLTDIEKIYKKLHKYQDKDPTGSKYLRFSLRDDATVVMMKFL